ncbi:uncharacterized protein DUF4268 [Rhizobium sp. PP-F2F-G20b]|nr:uncharacterized protein DUF4268 [Rhizobium sp. PP-F2F-G20b]
MFKIDRNDNRIQRLATTSFSQLGFRERAHLQEWIANQPDALGEDLLIIQKEFAGFSDTNERLDLLALDKQGSLVIIENKLDDTGRDVTWQALKYASYCARLTREDIKNVFQTYLERYSPGEKAEDLICTFLDEDDFHDVVLNRGVTQRVILVAANFRKEVTSTVLWLSTFNLRIQCFRVTPFKQGDDLFLSIDQIIPTKDAEEFMIGIAAKAQDEVEVVQGEIERHRRRRTFWQQLLLEMNATSDLFKNISPSKANHIGVSAGTRGYSFNFILTMDSVRVDFYIDTPSVEQNKAAFDVLFASRDEIEGVFGERMIWERLDGKRACRIKSEREVDMMDEANWPAMIDFLIDAMRRLDLAFRDRLAKLPNRAALVSL